MGSATRFAGKALTFVLAGGEGERLYPLTAYEPKPAVPFGGVFRIIDFTLSNLMNSGLRSVYLLTQYKHEQLQSYLRDGWPQLCNEFRKDCGEDILCLPPKEGRRYRGTADAVYQNLNLIEKSAAEYILILSGDQIYHMDYSDLLEHHHASGADLTMAAVPYSVDQASSFGVLEADRDGRVIGFEEKPASPRPRRRDPGTALVNMGVYVFRKAALMDTLRKAIAFNGGDDFGKDILPRMARAGRAIAFEFGGYWRDVGTLDSYYQTSLDLLLAGEAFDPYENAAWPTRTLNRTTSIQKSWLASDSRVSLEANLASCEIWMSIVSSGARIDTDAQLEAAVILPGAHIGSGARIRKAIVAGNAVVPSHECIGYDAESDRSRFHMSENGVVIVGAPELEKKFTPRNKRPVLCRPRTYARAQPPD